MYDHLNEVEEDFKDFHKSNEPLDKENPLFIKVYKNNMFLYLGYMILPILLSIFVIIAFADNEFFFRDVNPSEHAIENAISDVNSLLIVNPNTFDQMDDMYESFFIPIGSDGLSTIYVHTAATFITSTNFFIIETLDEVTTYTLRPEIFDGILDGSITNWPNNAKISFYIPINDVSPGVAGSVIDDSEILTGVGTVPTIALNALFAFGIMLIVAIPMVILSKPVIINDLNLLKKDNESVGTILSKSGIGILYMFAGNIVVGVLISILTSVLSIPDQLSANQLSINMMLKSPYSILIIITAVVIGPIVEELVFRKSFFGLIKNERYALIISSLVFGLIHITTEIISGDFGLVLINSLPYIAGGFVFGYIYIINKKNIVIPIIAHMGYNLISVLISLFVFMNL
jgi:membrane protease YdiL (CAAX protease family)